MGRAGRVMNIPRCALAVPGRLWLSSWILAGGAFPISLPAADNDLSLIRNTPTADSGHLGSTAAKQ